jgi:hypothetical protein
MPPRGRPLLSLEAGAGQTLGRPGLRRKASPPLQPGEVVSARKLRDRGRAAPRREHRPAVPSRGWRRTPMRQRQIEWLSVAVALRSRATTARRRACRLRRSPIAWVALRRRSRPTSTTPPARRPGRSRPATRGCAAAAGRTRSRGTGRATPTRTARPATPARSGGAGRASACWMRCAPGRPVTVAAAARWCAR